MTYRSVSAEVTWFQRDWSIPELIERKAGRTVSVVLPALNEQATIAGVLGSIRGLVGTLVDELVVIDSGSTDQTVPIAEAAGATAVYTREQAIPAITPRPGKGRCCGGRWP